MPAFLQAADDPAEQRRILLVDFMLFSYCCTWLLSALIVRSPISERCDASGVAAFCLHFEAERAAYERAMIAAMASSSSTLGDSAMVLFGVACWEVAQRAVGPLVCNRLRKLLSRPEPTEQRFEIENCIRLPVSPHRCLRRSYEPT